MKHNLLFGFGLLAFMIIGTGFTVTAIGVQFWQYSSNAVAYPDVTLEQREAIAQREMAKLENSWNSSPISLISVAYQDVTLEQREAIARREMAKLENSWNSSPVP